MPELISETRHILTFDILIWTWIDSITGLNRKKNNEKKLGGEGTDCCNCVFFFITSKDDLFKMENEIPKHFFLERQTFSSDFYHRWQVLSWFARSPRECFGPGGYLGWDWIQFLLNSAKEKN